MENVNDLQAPTGREWTTRGVVPKGIYDWFSFRESTGVTVWAFWVEDDRYRDGGLWVEVTARGFSADELPAGPIRDIAKNLQGGVLIVEGELPEWTGGGCCTRVDGWQVITLDRRRTQDLADTFAHEVGHALDDDWNKSLWEQERAAETYADRWRTIDQRRAARDYYVAAPRHIIYPDEFTDSVGTTA